MKRKDGKPKAARGSQTKMIDGVQHRKCIHCGKYLHPDAFVEARWQCEDCRKESRLIPLRMMAESFEELSKMGINPFEHIKS